MNICVLAYTHYESDSRVMMYAEALVQRGDHVDVLALRKEGQERREVIGGVHVHRIQRRVLNERMPLSFLLKIMVFLFNSALHLSAMHFKHKYDVIHVHSIPDFEVFAALVPKLFGAKCILDIHDIVPEYYADKFDINEGAFIYRGLLTAERLSARFSDHVIAANHIWAERLVGRSVPAEKCSVFLNYPNQTYFYKRPETPKSETFVMIYPGSLSPHQGLDVAVRAMAIVAKEAPEAQFHIYGRGGVRESLIELTAELGLGGNVKFYGFLPLNEIAEAMATADLALVPKRADTFGNEAFSTKILEFMSLGVPVLAADTEIDRYYFPDSEIKFFESGSEEDLARCILRLINDPAERERIARKGEEECASNYRWEEHKHRYFEIVDALGGGDS